MPSLLSSSEQGSIRSGFVDHFETFAREIVVFKTPKKTYTTTNAIPSQNYPGYNGTVQNTNNFTYTYQSGVFSGILIYEKEQKIEYVIESKTPNSKGAARLKVKDDAYNYITNGNTENVKVDGLVFNVNTDPAVQNFLGLRYYYFTLEQTS